MTYLVTHPFSGQYWEIENYNEAKTKLAEIRSNVIASEKYRFLISKEVVNGNDTTWMTADLNNDSEDYRYHVFNTLTGQHELVTSLSQAKTRLAEIEEQFISGLGFSLGLNDEPQLKQDQPISRGTQTL
jgi:hypothetical protein